MDTRTQVDGQGTNNLGGKGLVKMTLDVPQAQSQRKHKPMSCRSLTLSTQGLLCVCTKDRMSPKQIPAS